MATNRVLILTVAVALMVFCTIFGVAGGDKIIQGWNGKFKFTVETIGKSLSIKGDAYRQDIPLNDAGAGSVLVTDLKGNRTDEVIFLDLAGLSVGGDLRLFAWDGKSFEEITNSYFGNGLEVLPVSGKNYLLLEQHDSRGLYYVDKALRLDGQRLKEVDSKPVWKQVVEKVYKPKLRDFKDDDEGKSRIYSYMALAYKKIGIRQSSEQYFKKAAELDPHNPMLPK